MTAIIPFRRELDFEYGAVTRVSPLVRRVIARNPSPFTFHGTGTYIVGHGRVAVIDPGPLLETHLGALRAALAGETVSHIVITHTHLDHSPAAEPLKRETGAPTLGYGPHGADRASDGVVVEEGGDMAFVPDVEIRHGDVVEGDGWRLEAIHTPGHTSNHLCYALPEEGALFSGDHVMGWSTTVVSPPDGDMTEYVASLELLAGREDRRYWPTHGPAIDEPQGFVRACIAHREAREREVLDCVDAGRSRIDEMVPVIYRDVPRQLHRAAARSVLATLIHLWRTGRVSCEGAPTEQSTFERV